MAIANRPPGGRDLSRCIFHRAEGLTLTSGWKVHRESYIPGASPTDSLRMTEIQVWSSQMSLQGDGFH